MAKKKRAKKQDEEVATESPAGSDESNFGLNPEYYEGIDSFEIYATEKKATRIFGLRKKNADGSFGEPHLKARTRSKTPRGWKYIYGIDLLSALHVSRFIQGALSIAKKLGWKVQQAEDLEQLKSQLRDSQETIVQLEKTGRDERERHEKLMEAFRKEQEKALQSRVQEFEADVAALEGLITGDGSGSISEQDLQEFLYGHPWLFGTEYVNAQPQKLRGAHSKFDFYLERFNKTNDIVEIKLASDAIVTGTGAISAKVAQAVDQLIDYMHSSQAAAHSTVISSEEGIHELRPRGIVIIGNDFSSGAKEKLHKWNYQFAHISILTYRDVLERGKAVLQHLKSREEKAG